MSGIQPEHKQKLKMRLTALDTATCIDDMDYLVGGSIV
ncbi:MAG: hypothetical protein RBR08_13820 [Desulforegulaceae bacterium]|nr:hypothetical protein [Desulforegulaceae bacterium]